MSAVAFDTYKMIKTLRESGFTDKQAEAVTAAVQEAGSVDMSALATKADLKSEIAEVKNDGLKWMFGAMVAQTGMIVALIKLIH